MYTCGLKYVHFYVTLNVIRDTSSECWEDRLLLGTTSPENEPFIVGLLHCRFQQETYISQPGRVHLLGVLSEIVG